MSPTSSFAVVALLAIALSACLGGTPVSAQNNCNNPIFSGISTIKDNLFSTPGSAPSGFNSVCPNIQDGDPSCCGDKSSTGFQNSFNSLRSNIQKTSDLLVKQRELYFQQRSQLTSIDFDMLYEAIKKSNPNVDRDTLVNAFKNFLGAMDNFFNNFGNQYGQCLGGILKYMAGMYCSACTPNWGSIVTGTSPNLTLKLKDTTCSSLQNSCRPMFATLQELITALENYIKAAVDHDFNSFYADGICGSPGCDSFICGTMVAGISYNMPTTIIVQSDTDGFGVFPIEKMSVDNVRRTLTKLAMPTFAQSTDVSLLATSNSYSSSGYDAHNVGSNASPSVFDTSTSSFTQGLEGGGGSGPSSSSSSLSGGAIAGIVIGSVVFVAAVVLVVMFIVFKKNRTRAAAAKRPSTTAMSVVPSESESREMQPMEEDEERKASP